MIKVSIVIPIYNIEKYIKKLLDSIKSQTLKDIEVICVDDGSTDSCPGILDEYAGNDSRFKVIHVPNGGYGKAVNIGFDAASGEYIGIAESDDFILPGMYEALYNIAAENDLDVVKSDFCRYWSVGETAINSHKESNGAFYNKILTGTDKAALYNFAPSNWTGIYKKDFIEKYNIRHHETPGASYQDTGFWIQVISLAENIYIIDKAFYMYRQDNPASSMKNKSKMLDMIHECEWTREVIKTKGAGDEWCRLCTLYQLKSHKDTFKRIDDSLKNEYAYIIKNDYLNKKSEVIDLLELEQNKQIYEWLESAANDPEEVCGKIISEKNKVTEVLSSTDKMIIYGAGKRALSVCLKLYNLGLYDKISCVAVTGKASSDYFLEKPLKCIDVLNENDLPVLIAVKKGTPIYEEIKNKLESLDFHDIYDTEFISEL